MDPQLLTPVLIVLTGSFLLNLGFVLQKSQAKYLPSFRTVPINEAVRRVLQCRRWILGTLFTSFGWILFLLAISIAPITIIAPLNNSGVIVLALIALVYLNEKLALFEWVGFAMILMGVLIVPIFASSSEVISIPMDEFFLLILTGVVILSFILFKLFQSVWFPSKSGVTLGIISGVTGGMGTVFTKVISQIYTDFSILILTIFIVLVFQAISFVTLQNSFQKERATIIVPLFNSFSTLIPLIFGVIVFKELIPAGQFIGILLIVIGASAMFQYSDIDISEKEESLS